MIAKIDNLSVNYEVLGSGERLVLLHGWGANLHYFDTISQLLSRHFQVLSLDLPGFGRSSPPPTAFGIFDYAQFVEKFLDYLDIKETHLLGHSMGGAICLAYALSFNRAKKLILEDSAGMGKRNFWTNAKIYFVKALKFLVLPSYREYLKHLFGSTDYKNAGSMRGTLTKLVNTNLRPKIKELRQPLLIIWGKNDETTTLNEAKYINQEAKGSKLVIMPGCSHFPHLEQPEEFSRIVTDFLQKDYPCKG